MPSGRNQLSHTTGRAPSGGTATVARLLYDLTEPVLAPLRRVIPPVGMFDLSFTVLVFGLIILWQSVCS